MSYRAGIGYGMALLGLEPGPPHVFCDHDGCVARVNADGPRQPAWLRNNKPPRGWQLVRCDGVRRDYRPRHKLPKPRLSSHNKGNP